jgi:hypothetical protein
MNEKLISGLFFAALGAGDIALRYWTMTHGWHWPHFF